MPPEHFTVVYRINPWMDPQVPTDTALAVRQWQTLYDTYVELGFDVQLIDPEAGLPDMVYAANGGFVIDGIAYGASFTYPERQPEGPAYMDWFRDAGFDFWYSREDEGESFGRVSSEGGDIMPIGNGTVAIGMSERTTAQMIEKIALALFKKGAATRVIAAGMTRDRAHMHLDTVFTFVDRDCVTLFPKVIDSITAYSVRPADREGELDVRREPSFLGAIADALR